MFAVDDDLVEGLDNVQWTFSVASVANGYSDLIGPSVSVPIVGNDVAGLTVANSSIQFQWFDCLSQVTGVTQACLFSSSSQHGRSKQWWYLFKFRIQFGSVRLNLASQSCPQLGMAGQVFP